MTQHDSVVRLPDPRERPTMPVWPDTAVALGLSKAATYEGIARGEIPAIRIGRRLLVPTAALRRMLGLAATPDDELAAQGGAA